MTRTQIDKLGDRLKKGAASETDLRELETYRGSFKEVIETVINKLREKFGVQPAARIKIPRSIIEKLMRGSTKLSQIQDIAGCRLIVVDLAAQDQMVEMIKRLFADNVKVIDRRQNSSHGYRAVHVVVKSSNMLVEIQVRTIFQDVWAEISEKVAISVDHLLKYGGGPEVFRKHLTDLSNITRQLDTLEPRIFHLIERTPLEEEWSEDEKRDRDQFQNCVALLREKADLLALAAGSWYNK